MQCAKMINVEGRLLPCGQCINCRINKQRIWACRMQLEALSYKWSVFVTLTYAEEHAVRVAPDDMRTTLSPDELYKFIRRLRRNYTAYPKFRYCAVGEYGAVENGERAHYHLVLFGPGVDCVNAVEKSWAKGFVQVAQFTQDRAAYVAQYTLKKMTAADDRRLLGRWPEFFRASRNPGIGCRAIKWLHYLQTQPTGLEQLVQQKDVFNSVRLGGRIWPLGRYMKVKLRESIGLPSCAREREEFFAQFEQHKKWGKAYLMPEAEQSYPPLDMLESYSSLMRQKERYLESKDQETEGEKKAARQKRRQINFEGRPKI